VWHIETPRMKLRKVCAGAWETNAFVVVCAATGASVIVDAAADADRLIAATAGTAPEALLTTHGHFDHVGAARPVADRLGIPFRLHPDDGDRFNVPPDEPLLPGAIAVGDLELRVVHTPGHTPGSVVLILDGIVLSGDTLFPGGPGATSGPGADFDTIMASLDTSLFTLPDDTIVMPGHGLDTTIGAERPSLEAWRSRGW
jgi:glyoxylase-like metal-dependent hydrolase (beta-lactamase superfamily II)